MPYEFKEMRVGDLNLAYVERGHGAPVVLVHGSGATDLRTWGSQIEPFAEHHRVIAYSQRYHYPNPWIGDGSDAMSTFVHAGDLAALIEALQLGRVHLIGFSYGADIALRFAVERPELLRTLVVAEPALFSWLGALPGGSDLFAGFAATMIPAKRAVQEGDVEQGARLFIDAVMGSDHFDQLPPALHDRLMANVRLIGLEPTDIGEFVTDITRDDAASIRTPTLVLTGDQSLKVFLLVSQELVRHLPNAEKAQIAEASHLMHVMNPRVFNATVLAFLAKHAGEPGLQAARRRG
jgi:pimeloyl-ACP methyl ester carboxylesterase